MGLKENAGAAYMAGRLAAEKREKSYWVGMTLGTVAVFVVAIFSSQKGE